MHLYAAFFPTALRVPAHAFEYEVGKQCYGCRINDPEFVHPFGMLAASAVRYKFMPVTGVQIAIYGFKYVLRPTSIGICKRTATNLEGYTNVCQLVSVGKQRCRYLAQRIKPLDYGIKHYHQMNPRIKAFCIAFPA